MSFLDAVDEPPPRPTEVHALPAALAAAAEPGWLRGDLHCHTLHSDGDSWPADMLAHAVERGLEFLGVTDHNQVGHQADYARVRGEHLPILLPGIEVTTYGGHWNAWGTDTWWEFRDPTPDAVSRAMRAAANAGALVSVNHPKPFGPAWEYSLAIGYQAVEVWNGAWERLNHVALAWWEDRLRAGSRLVAVGGSDTHNLRHSDLDSRHGRMLGLPTTWAQVGGERSTEGVLAALQAGRAFISRDVDGPQLFLARQEQAVRVRVVGAPRCALLLVSDRGVEVSPTVAREDWADTFALAPGGKYIRAQLMDEHGQVLALTNPLFDPG